MGVIKNRVARYIRKYVEDQLRKVVNHLFDALEKEKVIGEYTSVRARNFVQEAIDRIDGDDNYTPEEPNENGEEE